MRSSDKSLPEFTDPPVVEVALSIQFDPLKKLRGLQLGLLWKEFKARFPVTEEHPPLEPSFERFGLSPTSGKSQVQIQLLEELPVPRYWFLNESGTQLIQVQQDRFVHNWRKHKGQEEYPRYEQLRVTFSQELDRFQRFLEQEDLGTLTPNQCEVTYVNHIFHGTGEEVTLEKILAPVSRQYGGEFLPVPESTRATFRYVIDNEANQPVGRLHIAAEPAYRTADKQKMYVLNLTARGAPAEATIEAAMGFLDVGREWVVRAFADITTVEMHHHWGRIT